MNSFTGTVDNFIQYQYRSDGVKLGQKVYTNGEASTTRDYCGRFVYENQELSYIIFSEGIIRVSKINPGDPNNPEFIAPIMTRSGTQQYALTREFHLKDHLGNTRIVFNSSGILSENHYYPFGLPIHNLSTSTAPAGKENRYLYNGKELQDDLGLNWMDYGARFYDAGLGRWHSVDPLGELAQGWSLYRYGFNNPIRYTDPTGMFENDDFIVQSMSGDELRRVVAPGPDIYVRVNEEAFNIASSMFSFENIDYNTMLSVWALRNFQRKTGVEGLVSEQTGIGLSITGSMRDGNNLLGDVSVAFQVLFDNGSKHQLNSFTGVAGGYGNGAPENGSYTVTNYQDRSSSGWYNRGMNRDGVGFSYNLNPQFSTGRSLLRIHPDGNNEGTLGCIGLTGDGQALSNFRNSLNSFLRTQALIPVIINIDNNPNHNGRNGGRIPDVNE